MLDAKLLKNYICQRYINPSDIFKVLSPLHRIVALFSSTCCRKTIERRDKRAEDDGKREKFFRRNVMRGDIMGSKDSQALTDCARKRSLVCH